MISTYRKRRQCTHLYVLHYDYTVSGSCYKNQDDVGFGLIIKLSYPRDGQHVKTPDYFINPIGVLHAMNMTAKSAYRHRWTTNSLKRGKVPYPSKNQNGKENKTMRGFLQVTQRQPFLPQKHRSPTRFEPMKILSSGGNYFLRSMSDQHVTH